MREIRIFYQKCAFWGTDSGVRLPPASANRWARLDEAERGWARLGKAGQGRARLSEAGQGRRSARIDPRPDFP